MNETPNYTPSSLPGESTEPRPEVAPFKFIPEPDITENVQFWLRLPIEMRPLRFIPGRNRREKRTYRKLASQVERGTISRGFKGRGGNIAKLRGLYDTLKALGILRDRPTAESKS